MRGPARLGVTARRVLPIFDDIEVKTAQLATAEIVHAVINVVELVVVVSRLYLALQRLCFSENPSVQRQERIHRQRVGRRIESSEVSQQESSGVSDSPVGVGGTLENLVRGRNLIAIVCCRDIQPQHIGTQVLHCLARGDNITHRFRHLAAVPIDGKTMG